MVTKRNNVVKQRISFRKTLVRGITMGATAYCLSFSVVPTVSTTTGLIFGKAALATITATALSQLAAGYLHTRASGRGMAWNLKLFGGTLKANQHMLNRRRASEKRIEALHRFFCQHKLNAFVINIMWESFTINYVLQTIFLLWCIENFAFNTSTDSSHDGKISEVTIKENEKLILLINGISRFLAGCLAGIITGVINQFWQRYQCNQETSGATLITERDQLPQVLIGENLIKVFTMIPSAVFTLMSSIPNNTSIYSLDPFGKRFLTDIIIINGGWLLLRDILMIVIMPELPPNSETPTNTEHRPVSNVGAADAEQSVLLEGQIGEDINVNSDFRVNRNVDDNATIIESQV